MLSTHFLRPSLDHPRTHQLLLRLLLEDTRFKRLFLKTDSDPMLNVKIEANNSQNRIVLYENGLAIHFITVQTNGICIKTGRNEQTAVYNQISFSSLISYLEQFLATSPNAPDNYSASQHIGLHYRNAMQQNCAEIKAAKFGKMPSSKSLN